MSVSRTGYLGPLTTTFIQPASCNSLPILYQDTIVHEGYPTIDTIVSGLTCISTYLTSCTRFISTTGTDSTSCFQGLIYTSTTDTSCSPSPRTTGLYLPSGGFYSPGLVCPKSYYSACTTTFSGAGDWQPVIPLTAGETAAGCCPRSVPSNTTSSSITQLQD